MKFKFSFFKNKIKLALVVVLFSISIVYAALNTALDLEGSVAINMNDDFKVFFSELKIDGVSYSQLINDDATSITFSSNNLNIAGGGGYYRL